jgi:hypothetical protein
MISFEEVSRHGRGRYLKVKLTTKIGKHDFGHRGTDNRTLVVTIGRIEFSRDGMFRYFEPKTHELNPILVDTDLKTLKKRIKGYRKGLHLVLHPQRKHQEQTRKLRITS